MLGASDTHDGRGRLIERAGNLPMTFEGAPQSILEGRLAAIPLVAIAVFDAATRAFSGEFVLPNNFVAVLGLPLLAAAAVQRSHWWRGAVAVALFFLVFVIPMRIASLYSVGHLLEAHAEATYIAMFVLHFVAVGLYCGLWMVDRRSWREPK